MRNGEGNISERVGNMMSEQKKYRKEKLRDC
jgi:hypothetical protein